MHPSKQELRQHLSSHPHHRDWRHQTMATLIGIFSFITICAVALILYGIYTKDRITFGVKVAGISVGGLSYSQAVDKINNIKKPTLDEAITIIVNNQKFATTPTTLGTSFDVYKAVDEAYIIGKQPNLLIRAYSMTEGLVTNLDFALETKHDEVKVNEYIAQIATTVNQEPQNANLKVESGVIVEVPSKEGVGVDTEKIKKEVIDTAVTLDVPKTIEGRIEILQPAIPTAKLSSAKQTAQTLTNYSLTLTFESQTYTVNQSIMLGWLDFTQNDYTVVPQISELKIKSYVDGIAKKIDIKPVDRKISDADKAVLDEGSDGRALNRTTLVAQIKNIIEKPPVSGSTIAMQVDQVNRGEKIVRQPFTPGLYPGKYIEVNISAQKMYLWEGTNKANEFQVSSGNLWSSPTPIGIRYVENKISNAWSNKYKVYMPWWMSIGGGYGIHELPYYADGRREGESYLGRAVSHGCIRLGIGAAETVYNWTDIGTPVYIHQD